MATWILLVDEQAFFFGTYTSLTLVMVVDEKVSVLKPQTLVHI